MSFCIMDSTMDLTCLQARIADLERELATLRTNYTDLLKKQNDIYYMWTKDDFVDLFKHYAEDKHYADGQDDDYVPSESVIEKAWAIWKEEFNERWSSSECHYNMTTLMETIMENHTEILFSDA